MTVTFFPSSPSGTVAAPPGKSMAHRMLICAGLAHGKSIVRGVARSEDMLATLDCLRELGAVCIYEDGNVTLRGADIFSPPSGAVLPCRECGSTLRFFIPLCLLSEKNLNLTGSETLLSRPLSVYEEICSAQRLRLRFDGSRMQVRGPLSPGEYRYPGDISSQFTSGLLFALPLLGGDSILRLSPPVESRPYIDMTLEALNIFGVSAKWRDETTLHIPGRQTYRPRDVSVEGDWSNAAFFLAMGDSVAVTGLKEDSLQGDKVCVAHFKALDAGSAEIDLSDCPDLGPVLMAYAASHGGGVFTGTQRLKIKESDRGEAMRAELSKFGVPVEVEQNRITVGCGLRAPAEPLDGHNDHRIVMALSVLCVRTGGTIQGAEAVKKSFPDFFDRLKTLNIDLISVPEGDGNQIGI